MVILCFNIAKTTSERISSFEKVEALSFSSKLGQATELQIISC